MAELVEGKSGVTGMKEELLLLISVDPGGVKSDCCQTFQNSHRAALSNLHYG